MLCAEFLLSFFPLNVIWNSKKINELSVFKDIIPTVDNLWKNWVEWRSDENWCRSGFISEPRAVTVGLIKEGSPGNVTDVPALHRSFILCGYSPLFSNTGILTSYYDFFKCPKTDLKAALMHEAGALSPSSDFIFWAEHFVLLNNKRIKLVLHSTFPRRRTRRPSSLHIYLQSLDRNPVVVLF